jgi:hypothetical protein
MWRCLTCGEESENNFEVCWNCQTSKGEFSGEDRPAKASAAAQLYECDACGADVSFDDNACPKCGADISEVDDSLANDNAGTGNTILQINLRQRYEYRMVQIPPSITVRQAIGNEAAFYLQRIVNEEASRGWEFMRVDTIGVLTPPGCLAGLFGGQVTTANYYVVTFRRETALQASDKA